MRSEPQPKKSLNEVVRAELVKLRNSDGSPEHIDDFIRFLWARARSILLHTAAANLGPIGVSPDGVVDIVLTRIASMLWEGQADKLWEASRPFSYISRMVKNQAIDERRRWQRRDLELRPTSDDVPTPEMSPELHSIMEQAVTELAPEQQTLLEERFVEGLTYKEIGQRHQITPAAASRRLRAAMGKLSGFDTGRRRRVFLGTSTHQFARPGDRVEVWFAAYTRRYEQKVAEYLGRQPTAASFDANREECQWRKGEQVTVTLDADGCTIEPGLRQTKWSGTYWVTSFVVAVPEDAMERQGLYSFSVGVSGVPITTLHAPLLITRGSRSEDPRWSARNAPRNAFASYASVDRDEVFRRISSARIAAGIDDVWTDCLSMRPGQIWQHGIAHAIETRDSFWLFWSRAARSSRWVTQEWKHALKKRGLQHIQPHPLESPEVAKPPRALRELHFNDAYMLAALAQSTPRGASTQRNSDRSKP